MELTTHGTGPFMLGWIANFGIFAGLGGRRAVGRCKPRIRSTHFDRLELRESLTISGFSAAATPLVLYPPNGRYVPVTVVGTVDVRDQNTAPNVNFELVDEYRKYESRGNIRTQLVSTSPRRYRFTLTIRIPASVASADKSGRQFYLIIAARNPDASTGKVFPIVVPPAGSIAPRKAG
jgi:hypothetical protein